MFFNGWQPILRVIIIAICAYAGMVILLRISGKRTLSKMNAFDFVVTVALGSTLATVLLSKDVSLSEGITAFVMLILLQYSITWLSVRAPSIRKIVKSQPALLLYRGEPLYDVMRSERITEEELRAAVREQGVARYQDVLAVVLETDGSISVLGPSQAQDLTSLASVANYPLKRQSPGD